MRKAITALAATALLFGVTAASAQTASQSDGKPSVSKQQRMKSPGRSTTGSGVTGQTPGSNPNPDWNKNPDPEVPGHPE